MTARPTTPASRREIWREDAMRLVTEFQDWKAGRGRESFPPWRIGYMHGLSDVVDDQDAFVATTARTKPHGPAERVRIPHVGKPSARLIDLLCWHMDQDVRWSQEWDGPRSDEVEHRLPLGDFLYDPVTAHLMREAGLDGMGLAYRIADSEDFGRKREVPARLPGATGAKFSMRMNEVHASFDLPGTEARWSSGCLTLKLPDLPETMLVRARGRTLSDLVLHPALGSPELIVTAITPTTSGRHVLTTKAATAAGMEGVHRDGKRTAA